TPDPALPPKPTHLIFCPADRLVGSLQEADHPSRSLSLKPLPANAAVTNLKNENGLQNNLSGDCSRHSFHHLAMRWSPCAPPQLRPLHPGSRHPLLLYNLHSTSPIRV